MAKKEMKFEEAMGALEQIVRQLEKRKCSFRRSA